MHFAPGERPDAARLGAAIEATPVTISADPARSGTLDQGAPVWLELLLDGMTFDLSGLAPGPTLPLPEFVHRFDCPADMLENRKVALRLVPGPHLAAGARSIPVARTMMRLAALLAGELSGLQAIGWGPSAALIGPGYFAATVEAWLAGGPFPALGLTAFQATADEGLQSVGLAFFTGQEVRLEPELVQDRTEATRLGVRLVNLLIGTGRLASPERITGPDGNPLRLEPSADGRCVRVLAG